MKPQILLELDAQTKVAHTRRRIISYIIDHGPSSITELSRGVELSVPTVTKFLGDLMRQEIVHMTAKQETQGGRPPQLYGLKPDAAYFMGVDIRHDRINIGLIDFVGSEVETVLNIPFVLENTEDKLEELIQLVSDQLDASAFGREHIININISIPGRVSPDTGGSYTLFNFNPHSSLGDILSDRLGCHVTLENDTRAMAYGEYSLGLPTQSARDKYPNILYINFSWGLGLGIILGQEMYLGRSGFSGELGHMSVFDNQILCHCGKRGCLETEVGGLAMKQKMTERIRAGEVSSLSTKVLAGEELKIDDLVQAISSEDPLAMEVLEDMGIKLGRQVANLINVFNPDMVIVGGTFSAAGDFLAYSIQHSMRTYSLNIVNRDTKVVTALMGDKVGLQGACMLSLRRRFSEISRK